VRTGVLFALGFSGIPDRGCFLSNGRGRVRRKRSDYANPIDDSALGSFRAGTRLVAGQLNPSCMRRPRLARSFIKISSFIDSDGEGGIRRLVGAGLMATSRPMQNRQLRFSGEPLPKDIFLSRDNFVWTREKRPSVRSTASDPGQSLTSIPRTTRGARRHRRPHRRLFGRRGVGRAKGARHGDRRRVGGGKRGVYAGWV
jgi:hypothetical protein